MTFAEKLKSIRKQVGMSQELLAEKIGVSRQANIFLRVSQSMISIRSRAMI